VIILGACFPPREIVTITICDDRCDRVWDEEVVNSCGAFRIDRTIPSWVDTRTTVSVKAWLDIDDDGRLEEEDGDLQACWPLYIR
jgi:hypothetical protein